MRSRLRTATYHEGADAAQQFDGAMTRILKVSKEELAKREASYQKARANKDRPGPKRRSR